MKIAVIGNTTHPLHEPFYRGIERFTHSLTKKLLERGHEVTLFAKDSDLPCQTRPILNENENQELQRLRKSQKKDSADKIQNLKNKGYLRAMKEIAQSDFDIIHNNSLDSLPLLASSRMNSLMLTTLHTPPKDGDKVLFQEMREHINSYFCATSHFTKQRWKESVGELDVAVIHNGALDLKGEVTLNFTKPENNALWVGAITPQKGLHMALKACHLAGVCLKFAGAIEDENYFRKVILPLMGNNDHYLGHLGHEELKREMEMARVGLATAQPDEPLGLATIEMLSYGLPIVSFKGSASSEIVNEENGTLVEASSPLAMAKGINSVKGLCKVRIQQQTIQKWTLDTMVAKYERVYKFLKALDEKDRKRKAYWYLYSSSKQGTLA